MIYITDKDILGKFMPPKKQKTKGNKMNTSAQIAENPWSKINKEASELNSLGDMCSWKESD